MTGFTRRGGLELGQLFLHPRALGLQHPALEIADDALERLLHLVGFAPVLEAQRHRQALGAIEDDVAMMLAELVPRRVEIKFELPRERSQHLHVIRRGRIGFCPGHDRALLDAQRRIGDDQLGVEMELLAEPVAGRAGSLGRVEREQARGDFLDGEAADRAGEAFGKDDPVGRQAGALHLALGGIRIGFARHERCLGFGDAVRCHRLFHRAIGEVHKGQPVGQAQRGLKTVGEPLLHAFAHHQPVDHDLDVMLELLVELGTVLDIVKFAVDPDPGEAGFLPFEQFLAIFALASAHHGGEQEEAGLFRQGHHPVDHLRHGLRGDRQAGGGRIGNAGARPEQAHIVVNLGHGGDGRARIARSGLLLDRDRRRQALDMLDIGLLHHLEKLARIGGQALDIASLPLGIDGVEGETGLAGAGQAGDHDQLLARKLDIDALEIMLAGTFYFNVGQTHARALPKMPGRVQRVKRTGWSALYVQCLFSFQ